MEDSKRNGRFLPPKRDCHVPPQLEVTVNCRIKGPWQLRDCGVIQQRVPEKTGCESLRVWALEHVVPGRCSWPEDCLRQRLTIKARKHKWAGRRQQSSPHPSWVVGGGGRELRPPPATHTPPSVYCMYYSRNRQLPHMVWEFSLPGFLPAERTRSKKLPAERTRNEKQTCVCTCVCVCVCAGGGGCWEEVSGGQKVHCLGLGTIPVKNPHMCPLGEATLKNCCTADVNNWITAASIT